MDNSEQQFSLSGNKKALRTQKTEAHLDMTPMVDLAFLLLTFFMLTTTFLKATWMDIAMPVKGPPQPVAASQSLTLLLTGSDSVLWYSGMDDFSEGSPTGVASLDRSGPTRIRQIILEKNKLLLAKIQAVKDSAATGLISNNPDELIHHFRAVKAADKEGLMVQIKADEQTKYKSLVAVLDEMLFCQVAHYAITDLTANERQRIKEATSPASLIQSQASTQ